MSFRSLVVVLGIGLLMLCSLTPPSHAALTSQDKSSSLPDAVQMQQYLISNARLPGYTSARQTVTAWQVTQGTWNGEQLSGLNLVLVRSISEDGRALSTTNCYV